MLWQIIFILVVLIPLVAIILDSQVGRALASRLERRGLEAPPDVLQERLAYLEGEVERLSQEVERLSEESEFLTRLLAGRAGEDPDSALPPGEPRS